MLRSFVMIGGLAAASVRGQAPQIAYRGIWNAASLMPGGLPGGGISRGALFTITGRNIGPTVTPALATPPQAALGGVSIAVTQGTTTVAAIPIELSTGRIDALMPKDAPLGMVSVRVTFNNARSNPMPVRVVPTQFGIFTVNGAGAGPAMLSNVADDLTATPNTLQGPAMPGQTVTLLGTGLGTGVLEVRVGGLKAVDVVTSTSATQLGVDAVSFSIPSDAPTGCWTPLYVKTASGVVSNFATIAISADGTACQEPSNALASALVSGGNIGSYFTTRISVRHEAAVRTPRDSTTDLFVAHQSREQMGPANFNPMFSLPPAGSCTIYTVAGDVFSDVNVIIPGMTPPTGGALDGGAVSLTGNKGLKTAQSGPYPGITAVQLGSAIPSLPLTNQTFFDSGGVTLAIAGSADIGPASVDSTPPPPFTWTNRDQVLAINRSTGVNLTWADGAADSSIFMVVTAADMPSNSSAAVLCIAPPGSTSFNIPADVLTNIPPTLPRAVQSRGALYLGQWNLASPVGVSAAGLDFGSLMRVFVGGKTVMFQ